MNKTLTKRRKLDRKNSKRKKKWNRIFSHKIMKLEERKGRQGVKLKIYSAWLNRYFFVDISDIRVQLLFDIVPLNPLLRLLARCCLLHWRPYLDPYLHPYRSCRASHPGHQQHRKASE